MLVHRVGGGLSARPNVDLLPALEIPARKVIDNLSELILLFLFYVLEFEGVAVKAAFLVVFDPLDFGLLHVNEYYSAYHDRLEIPC